VYWNNPDAAGWRSISWAGCPFRQGGMEEGWGFQGLCVIVMDGYDLCTGTIQTLLAGGQLLGLGAHFGLNIMGSFYYRRSVVNVQRERSVVNVQRER